MKKGKKYIKYFRNAYNNPSQYSQTVERFRQYPDRPKDEIDTAIIEGVAARNKDIENETEKFLMTDKDTQDKINSL